MSQTLLVQLLPVLAALAATILTAAVTLITVGFNQRSALRLQKQQSEAAAALDRERREHEAKLAQEARAAEDRQRRLEQRLAAYSEFLAMSDTLPTDMAAALDLRRDLEPFIAKMNTLWATAFRVMLVAPETTNKFSMMLVEDVRRAILALNNRAEREPAMRKLQASKRVFLEAARSDLGVSDDSAALLRAYRSRMGEKERALDTNARGTREAQTTIDTATDRATP